MENINNDVMMTYNDVENNTKGGNKFSEKNTTQKTEIDTNE